MIEREARSELEKKIGYNFRDVKLLENALTHSSYANERENSEIVSNERLEFLGDAVTGLEIALLIYENGPEMSEGQMTTARAALVRSEGLANAARSIDLGRYLFLGVGAEKTGVRENEAVLEDAFEALVAAVFLDGGTLAARGVLRDLFTAKALEKIEVFSGDGFDTDYKSKLQEECQKRRGASEIRYLIKSRTGPDHDKTFRVVVTVNGTEYGEGTGKSKKNAEKMAAKMALEELKCI